VMMIMMMIMIMMMNEARKKERKDGALNRYWNYLRGVWISSLGGSTRGGHLAFTWGAVLQKKKIYIYIYINLLINVAWCLGFWAILGKYLCDKYWIKNLKLGRSDTYMGQINFKEKVTRVFPLQGIRTVKWRVIQILCL
jgi:hypothetical protein